MSVRNTGAIAFLLADFFSQMKPKPRLTVSQWADEYAYLPSESSADPGKFYSADVPYIRGFQDAANEPGVYVLGAMWGSQTAKTTAITNIHGYFSHQEPCPQLMMRPTDKDSKLFMKTRIKPFIRDTKALREIYENRLSTLDEIYYNNGAWCACCGSNSVADASGKSVRVYYGDEVDRFETTAEGDIIAIALKRLTTFWNSLAVITSTPKDKDTSAIWRWWNRSDKRMFFVPCPHCGHEQVMKWDKETIIWDTDPDGTHHPDTARYVCEHCKGEWNDTQINEAVRAGEWRATAPFRGIAFFGMLPEWYAPWKKLSATVQDYLDNKDDPDTYRVWWNTALGLPWDMDPQALETADVYELRERYDPIAPMNSGIVTCAVDTQDDRLEILTKAWGPGEESWALEHLVFWGDTSIIPENLSMPGQGDLFGANADDENPWACLDEFLQTKYQHESGAEIPIAICCIDTGGHRTDQVYQFVKMRERKGVRGIKGDTSPFKQLLSPPSKSKRSKAGRDYKIKLFMIGTNAAKDTVNARLRHSLNKPPEERFGTAVYHYPDSFTYEFFEQLTVEKKVRRKSAGRYVKVWENVKNERNEAFDLEVYSLAALRMKCPNQKALADRCEKYSRMIKPTEHRAAVIAEKQQARRRRVRSSGVL